jgi:hypothetical protein
MKVTIGIPYYQTLTPETVHSLFSALRCYPQHDYSLSLVGGTAVGQQREAIIDEALAEGSERLVFIDSDIAFPTYAISSILAHHAPIIGAAYNYKRHPTESVVQPLYAISQRSPVKVAVLPAGFMSLHLPTLVTKLPRPWFWYGHRNGGTSVGEHVGEDINFCRHARAHGLETWCDPSIPLKHMGTYAY